MKIIFILPIICLPFISGWSQTDSVTEVVSTHSKQIYTPVSNVVKQDREATFPGGMQAFKKYLAEHFNYSYTAIENGIEGTVIVTFLIREDGKAVNPEIVNSLHPIIDDEAIRVITSMPVWSPRIQNGRSVPSKMEVPFSVRIR